MSLEVNVVIDQGVSDWQIFQQAGGQADIAMAGRWELAPNLDWKTPVVLVRAVKEDSYVLVTRWTPMKTRPDGTWSGVLKGVPSGGLYRIETMLAPDVHTQWALHGQVRHHVGVGDLWIIAGQSNSAGYGQGPVWDPPENGVHMFNNAMRWGQACHPMNESTGTQHAANRESANPIHSPWLHWARRVKQEVGHPIGLVQTSLGGSPLVSWNPTEPGEHPLYEAMLQAVNAAGGKARGMLWYQGCSDTPTEPSKSYQKRFMAAVKAWRKALKCPQLFILTVQLNRCFGATTPEADANWARVREAQRRVSHELEHCCVIPTLDLPLSDCIHNSAHGNLLLAERAAQAALGCVYGKQVAWAAPEIASASASRDGLGVELSFDNVTNALHLCDSQAMPFAVEDEQGRVDVAKMEIAPPNVVKLTLGRKLGAKAVVHGARGMNPPHALHDYGRFLSMLAFDGVAISPAGKSRR